MIESGNAASFAALTGQVRFNGGVFHVTVLADETVTAALDGFALVCG